MKKYFLSLVAMLIAAVSFAQSTLVATLTHGDEISMYYGAFALQDAHAAAVDGDVINLSGGGFLAVNITKAITLRGTGINDAFPTRIINDFNVKIPASATERLSIEGCHIQNTINVEDTLTNATFIKNSIGHFLCHGLEWNKLSCLFAQCNIYKVDLGGNSSAQFVNSHVENFKNNSEKSATASFVNCIILPGYGGSDVGYIKSSQLVNSILCWTGGDGYPLPKTSTAFNCVAVGEGSHNCFNDVASQQNCKYAGLDIFQDSDLWKDLTDEAKANYLGNDGTPVGKFGGALPYDMTPSYPLITKMNVANKTTADGKLSVEIEVSSAQ